MDGKTGCTLTLALHAVAVDGGTADHDVVDDREAAFAANPVTLAVPDAAVGQDGRFVEPHTAVVELLRDRDFVRMKKVPDGAVDNLIRRVSQDVDNGVGRVEDMGIIAEV